MKSVIWQNLTSQAESFTGSHHRSWQDSQSPIKRNVWPILKFLQGKSQHVALATEADSWNPPGVLRGSSFSLTYFCPDVIQSPLTLCWTPGEGGADKRIPTKTTSPPLSCSRRVLGGTKKKGEWKGGGLEEHRRALSCRNGGCLSFANPVLLPSPPQTTLSPGPNSVKKPASLPADLPFMSSYNPDCLCLPAGPVFSFTCTCICRPFPKPKFLEERFKWEGTYIHLWLSHVDMWQKSSQYYKANILQLKINIFFKNPKFLESTAHIWGLSAVATSWHVLITHISSDFKDSSKTSFPWSRLPSTQPTPLHPLSTRRRNYSTYRYQDLSGTPHKAKSSVLALFRRWEADLYGRNKELAQLRSRTTLAADEKSPNQSG